MSRIQTPTVNVNPNVELASREAPTIVYQPEPYVPETYFDYEQLSNVLGAGVQAAKTFLNIEREAAQTARQNEILKFKTGLSQAKLKATQIAEETGSFTDQPIKDFLSTYDYDKSLDEIKILMNSEWQGLAEFSIETEQKRAELVRKNNTDILSFEFQTAMDRMVQNFHSLDPKTQQILLNSANDPEAMIALTVAQFDQETLARWNTIETVDRGALIKTLADDVNRASASLRDINKEINDRATASKVVALDAVRTASILQTAYMPPSGDGVGPVRTIEDEYQIYLATRMEMDRTITEDKVIADWTNMLRNAAIRVAESPEASPEAVDRFRQVVEADSRITGDSKGTILSTLKTAMELKITEKYEPGIDRAVAGNDLQMLDYMQDMLKTDPLVNPRKRADLDIRINGARKQIANQNLNEVLSNEYANMRLRMMDGELTAADLLQFESELMGKLLFDNQVRDSKGNPVFDQTGKPIKAQDIASVMKLADEARDRLEKENTQMVRTIDAVQVQGIEAKLMAEAQAGRFNPTQLTQEIRVFPSDQQEKILSNMDQWFKTEYLPAIQQALMTKYKLTVWDVPAGQQYPGNLRDRDSAHAEFIAMRVSWANVGGDREFGNHIRQDLFGSLSSDMEKTGASPGLRDALSMYRMRGQIGTEQLVKFFGDNDLAKEYMIVLRDTDAAVRRGMDVNEAFKDATQRYRLDPARVEFLTRLSPTEMDKLSVELQAKLDSYGDQAIQDSYPLVRHIFLNAALVTAPPESTIDQRIELANEAIDSQLTVRGNSILPVSDLNSMNQGPTFVSVAAEYLTGIEDAAMVVVDFDRNTGEYIYALRNKAGNSIATKEFPDMPELSNVRTFKLSDFKNERLQEAVVAETPKRMKRDEAKAKQEFRDRMMRGGYKPGFIDVYGGP